MNSRAPKGTKDPLKERSIYRTIEPLTEQANRRLHGRKPCTSSRLDTKKPWLLKPCTNTKIFHKKQRASTWLHGAIFLTKYAL